MQLAAEKSQEITVCVVEKGSEIGAHCLSGNVFEPTGLNELIPDWKEKGAPLNVPVRDDNFYMLGEAGEVRIPNWPMPPLMNNHGNYIVSMGNVCRWMAEVAEGLGVSLATDAVFPDLAVQMVQVGEQSGELETMLYKIADVYENDVQASIMSMMAMLEPVMILVMAVVVLFIVLSICLPIFEMNQMVG